MMFQGSATSRKLFISCPDRGDNKQHTKAGVLISCLENAFFTSCSSCFLPLYLFPCSILQDSAPKHYTEN